MLQAYLIILSAFALLGLYFFIVTLISIIDSAKYPPSVTVLKADEGNKTAEKIKFIEENVPNSYTVLCRFDGETDVTEEQKILYGYVKSVLDVNKK